VSFETEKSRSGPPDGSLLTRRSCIGGLWAEFEAPAVQDTHVLSY